MRVWVRAACRRSLAAGLAVVLVLAEAGASYAPSGRVLIQEVVVGSAVSSIDFSTGINSTYKSYIIEYWAAVPATDNSNLYFQVATGCPSSCSWKSGATDYLWGIQSWSDAPDWGNDGAVDDYGIPLSYNWRAAVGNASGEGAWGTVQIFNPSDSAAKTRIRFLSTGESSDDFIYFTNGFGDYETVGAVSGFRLRFYDSVDAANNVTAGTFRLYGIK